MNERIRQLRKSLGLTLEEFGAKVGVTKQTVSRLENGVNAVTEQMFKSICREFSVNEEWLRSGIGEMLNTNERKTEIERTVNEALHNEPDSFRSRFISALASLDSKEWAILEKIARDLVENPPTDTPDNIVHLNAAHSIDGASDEDKQHDEDIMNDENF